MKLVLIICLLLWKTSVCISQEKSSSFIENVADTPWKISKSVDDGTWRGFKVRKYAVGKFNVWVAEPKKKMKGNPWVMGIQDFGDTYHWQINEKLLKSGVCVVAINSYNTYGADLGLNMMDSVYRMANTCLGLSEKCVLTAISRAGLSVYRWATKHPERVAAIYCEGPVLDFKTWPMSWKPSAGDWAMLKSYYDFASDEEAVAYEGNPVDNLGVIAQYKIPIRHVISLTEEHDIKIVPNEKNTLKAWERLRKMGHDMDVVIVPPGMRVPYEFDDESVRFIVDNLRHID